MFLQVEINTNERLICFADVTLFFFQLIRIQNGGGELVWMKTEQSLLGENGEERPYENFEKMWVHSILIRRNG